MTPEERKLVTDLFDRLAALEDAQRDPEAERLMKDGLRQAPNALYALVQTVLVQDEALKRAGARIQELEQELNGPEPEPPPRDTSFLGGVRDSLLGRRDARGSVPSVRPNEGGMSQSQGSDMSQQSGTASQGSGMSPAWRTGAPASGPAYAPPPPGSGPGPMPGYGAGPMPQGGSFLGNAAAAAAGAIGGSLLMNGIRNLMGSSAGTAHAAVNPAGGTGGDLSRQAGAGDVGRTPASQMYNDARDDAEDDRQQDQDAEDDRLQDQDEADDMDDDDDYDDDGGNDGDE